MTSYFVAQIKIHDWDEYEKYLEKYDNVFDKFKGKVIAVDAKPTLLEGKWPYSRTVIIKFPNENEALRWYNSKEYRELVQHRHKASDALFLKETPWCFEK